ncbi:hypothetical protein CU098_004701 [Rhizopus stolonifer]|uniref:Uncharacterized protein n=1 Tax=Rhizopus stolonifer TaxID=4846 RepID=A0A367IKQ7_RHIST|nr:hypothetical protein CU098_004701 [Rhizopus stolonifer]
MPKPLHTRSPKVVSFSVKRKQINFNLLERNSSQASFQSTESYRHQPGYQTLLQEKEDQINQLKTELDKTQRELSASRHQTRLMENERHQFEASVTKTCSLEKDQIQLELNILKETHTEKMQYYSSTMNQLYKTIQVLKQRLSKYEDEAQEDQELFLDEHYDQYQAEYEFIKDAYLYTTQETTHQSSLWSSIQVSLCCLNLN